MRNIILIIVVVLNLAAIARAAPQDEFNQLTAEIQKNPGDYVLREKIIKHVQTMVPRPQVPQEAKRPFMKAVTFQKEATSVSDYELAISAYKEALLLVPWWPEAIYNMALAQEGAGKFDDAIQSLKLYLLTGPKDAKDAEQAENRMYAMEAKKEKAAKDALQEAQEKEKKFQELIQGLSGTWIITKDYQSRQNPDYNPDAFSNEYYQMGLTGQNTFSLSWYKSTGGPFERQPGFFLTYTGTVTGLRISGTLSSRDNFTPWGCGMMDFSGTFEGTISPDGKKIQMTISRTEIDNPNACTKKNVVETIEFIKE